MANKPIPMSKLKTLNRLLIESASKSKISRSTGLSRNTVKTYLQKLESLPLSPADFLALHEHDLYQLLQEHIPKPSTDKLGNLHHFFRYEDKELKKPSVTRKLLWDEYIKQHQDGSKESISSVYARLQHRLLDRCCYVWLSSFVCFIVLHFTFSLSLKI